MSDVSLSLQQQFSQALNQLSKAGSDSVLVQKGAEVLVQRLAGNQMILRDPRTQKQLQLDTQKLQGNLIEGKSYQARLDNSSNQTLMSFLPATASGEQQLQQISLNAAQLKTLIKAIGEQRLSAINLKDIVVDAKITSVQGSRVSLRVTIGKESHQINLDLPQHAKHLKTGQQVEVKISSVKGNWHVQLLTNKSSTGVISQSETPKTSPPVAVRPGSGQASAMLQSVVTQPAYSSKPVFEISSNDISRLSQILPSIVTPQFKKALQTGDISKVLLQPQNNGQYSLTTNQVKAAASLPLDNKTIEQIKTLIPEIITRSQGSDSAEKLATDKTAPPVLQQPHSSAASLGAKKQLQSELLQILRRVIPAVQSPSESLMQLDKTVNLKNIQDPILKPQLEQIMSQIKQGVPQGKDTDQQAVKQILSTAPLNLSPAGLTTPTTQQGMMGGLIALLQVALASRMVRSQNGLAERMTQFVSQILAAKGQGTTPAGRANADFSQMDPRGQLLKEIGKIFASHQASKLTNTEQSLQGQDSFYYALPSTFGNAARDIELLIRREPDKQSEQQKKASKNSTWHLTMKLSVGEKGEMLTKARLTQEQLEIDFYTSNEEVKLLILEHLPLLKKRFEQVGIELGNTQCQLGKIPKTLQNKPYGIFEAKA